MIRAIVVDLGGVLFSEGKSVVLDRLAVLHGYDRAAVASILSSPQSMLLRKGLLSDVEFWHWAQTQLPPGYDSALIQREWYDSYILDQEVYNLIARLRNRYSIIAFSGNIRSRIDYLETKYRFRHLFNLEVYSFDVHHTKPEREFVEIMLGRSGVRPDEMVYIDDNESYAQPARHLGINVVIHRKGATSTLLAALRGYGVDC